MDKCSTDAEFDSYWDFEAKNKNRNRIRVGRQYQATVPLLLKPGEKDTRKCEDLETLKWKPDQLSEQDIDEYLSMAKAVSSFARTIENYRGPEKPPENSLQTAIKGLTDFVTSHHPCHRDAGCKVPVSASSSSSPSGASSSKSSAVSDWTPPEARLFVQALETCGKNFCAIKKEFLPWKPVRSLIEYYYYFNGKGEKSDSPKPKAVSPTAELHFDGPICKVEKTEPVASSSQETEMVESPDTKEEIQVQELVKSEPELQATSCEPEEKPSEPEELPPMPKLIEREESMVQSTVGSLKFFLGGRLVLKLNAQQDSASGTKCQWVQSHDTPRHGHQSKKMRHRKKSIQDVLPQVSTSSPKQKKKHEEESPSTPESSVKKLKLKTPSTDAFPLLCSSSWTPPIADGPDTVELEDASSKTSEGHDSPVVATGRGIKGEVSSEALVDAKRSDVLHDVQDSKHDKKLAWHVTDPIPGTSSDICEEYSSRSSSFTSEKISPDISYSHEVLNHKSALTHSKTQVKSSSYQPRAAHSGSPNAKLFNKWPCSNVDLERTRCLPCFHSPNSLSCHASSESPVRDFVLDLSSKPGYCKTQESRISQEQCCSMYPNECTENCSSSEESAHNDSSLCCIKSSNLVAYNRRDTPVPGAETSSKSDTKNFIDVSQNSDCEEKYISSMMTERLNESSGQCLCCYNPSTSCASPKCCKSYSSKEQMCNKGDFSPGDSPSSVISSAVDVFSKKQQPWFGTSVTPLLQMYSPCYPYYVAYNLNQPVNANASTSETPLDLSNNEETNEETSLPDNITDVAAGIPNNTTEAMDRGMLYQLLKNKVNK